MPTVNQVNVTGALQNLRTYSGGVYTERMVGELTNILRISGSTSIPTVLNKSAIHYDTTEAWNSQSNLIAEAGHIYIYSDYTRSKLDDGSERIIPAIKIGDGSSFLIDMPFTVVGDPEAWIEHINNRSIHVSDTDRPYWDNKITVDAVLQNEELIFTI